MILCASLQVPKQSLFRLLPQALFGSVTQITGPNLDQFGMLKKNGSALLPTRLS
jgi:hypothetical protein